MNERTKKRKIKRKKEKEKERKKQTSSLWPSYSQSFRRGGLFWAPIQAPRPRKTLDPYATRVNGPIHHHGIRVKFVYEGHRVKVKVTGAKKSKIPNPTM